MLLSPVAVEAIVLIKYSIKMVNCELFCHTLLRHQYVTVAHFLTHSVDLTFRPKSGFKKKCRARYFGPGSGFKMKSVDNSDLQYIHIYFIHACLRNNYFICLFLF